MRWVSSTGGVLRTLESCPDLSGDDKSLVTGLPALDGLLPLQSWRLSGVHEVLSRHAEPILALLVARQAAKRGVVAWCDPAGQLYLPAAVAMGLKLDRLILLRPRNVQEQLWAMIECLRCKGVAAMVGSVQQLSMLDARRLQLAAEGGGGVGVLLRPISALHQPYAAATRWMVHPQPGERTVRRWKAQLIHGHGGRVGESVILEVCRDTNHVRASEAVADRLAAQAATAITA